MQMTMKEDGGTTAGTLIMLQTVIAAMLARHPQREEILASLSGFPEGLARHQDGSVASEAVHQAMAQGARYTLDALVEISALAKGKS